MQNIVKALDNVANNLEAKGLFKEASQIDVIANTIEAGMVDKIKASLSKIPGASQLMNTFKGMNPKQVAAKLIQQIGNLSEEEFNAAKQFAAAGPGFNAERQANIMQVFRDKKKAVMSAILITILAGTFGKALAQMDYDDYKKFVAKQQSEFSQFIQDQGDSESAFQELERYMEKEDISKVSPDTLSKAEVKTQQVDAPAPEVTPSIAKALADSIIRQDAETVSKYLKLPFSFTVKSFDYRTDADKIEDPEVRQLAIDSKIIKSDVTFNTFKPGYNLDSMLKLPQDMKTRIIEQYSMDDFIKLLNSSFLQKMMSDKNIYKAYQENSTVKENIKNAIINEVVKLARTIYG